MAQLLVALDDSAAARPVVDVARYVADLVDLEVVALHVSENGTGATARAIADASGIKFDLYRGNPVQIIREQAAQRDVRMLGIGARGLPAHRMPAGHVTLDVVRSVPKPVLVVPPDVRLPTTGPLRVLAPIDEEPASAATLRWLLAELKVPSLDLVLLRVVDAAHMPRFANHPPGEAEVWAAEFVRATVPREAARTRVETRVGDPAHAILDVERQCASDLVVLSWGCDLSRGHAAVIKRLLSHTNTALLLVPVLEVAGAEADRPATTATHGRILPAARTPS